MKYILWKASSNPSFSAVLVIGAFLPNTSNAIYKLLRNSLGKNNATI